MKREENAVCKVSSTKQPPVCVSGAQDNLILASLAARAQRMRTGVISGAAGTLSLTCRYWADSTFTASGRWRFTTHGSSTAMFGWPYFVVLLGNRVLSSRNAELLISVALNTGLTEWGNGSRTHEPSASKDRGLITEVEAVSKVIRSHLSPYSHMRIRKSEIACS